MVMEASVIYFHVAWITCFLMLLMIFLIVNCLRRRQRLPVFESDTDRQCLIPHDHTDKSHGSVDTEAIIYSVQNEDRAIPCDYEVSREAISNHEESSLTLKEILDKAWIARNKWETIGIQLGLENDIDAIRHNRLNNAGDCYLEMLTTWIKKERATWEKLTAALSHESVGFCELANSILAELQDPIGDSSRNDDGGVDFTIEPNMRSVEGYNCRLCGSYSLEQCFKQKCPRLRTVSDSSSFPHLDTKQLTEAQKNKLHAQLRDQTADMITSFADLVLDMQRSLKSRKVDPLEVASAALLISRRETSTRRMSLLSQELGSVDKLISYLVENNYVSFFNYHIVQYIIDKYGSETDRTALCEYEEKFKKFCKRSIFEIPQDVLGPIPKNEERLVFKITQELIAHLPSGHTSHLEERLSLNDVQILRDKVAKVLQLENSWCLTFLGASKGCIELTFSATSDVVDVIKSQLRSRVPTRTLRGYSVHLADLEKIGIRLLCGPPGKPRASEITDTSVCLRWSKPEYEGCYPIQYYVVHCRFVDNPGSTKQDVWHTNGESQTLKITNLPQNETITFSVQAVTNVGHGIQSEESECVELPSAGYKIRSSSMRRPRAYTGDDFSKPLTVESVDELVLKLNKAKKRWHEIGLKLGLDPELLDKIKSEHRNIPKDCLEGMLTSWLGKGNASKQALCDALNDQSVRFHDLSNSIADSLLGTWKVNT